ncbi:hypothetical protein J1N35_005781 [Gossypium stocksii]|uniref:DUF4216 domain-containing protein n=1 Tax=Gossypium stocksii TaxID=47602 RepID=A0A9D3WEG6_9ROSI|nr:hypothetical protein J1N35_005781 [Gossypium stocksii]
MVNFSRLIHAGQQLIDEPYVFSSQVKQVFYLKDPTDEGWYVVVHNTPRDLIDMGNGSRDDINERLETLLFPKQNLNETIPSTNLSIIQNPPNLEETNSDQQTTIGYSNVPNTFDEPVEIQTENGGWHKIRGCMLLKDLYNLNFVECVKVSRKSHGHPIRSEARLLLGYLGITA